MDCSSHSVAAFTPATRCNRNFRNPSINISEFVKFRIIFPIFLKFRWFWNFVIQVDLIVHVQFYPYYTYKHGGRFVTWTRRWKTNNKLIFRLQLLTVFIKSLVGNFPLYFTLSAIDRSYNFPSCKLASKWLATICTVISLSSFTMFNIFVISSAFCMNAGKAGNYKNVALQSNMIISN